MKWTRKRHKNCKVYVWVDKDEQVICENGLGKIKYRSDETEKFYNVKPQDIKELNEVEKENSGQQDREKEEKKNKKEKKKKKEKKAISSELKIQSTDKESSSSSTPKNKHKEIIIYTDGACTGNPGPAGAGIVLIFDQHRKEISYPLGQATNNIAELTAIKMALESLKVSHLPIKLHTDSQYSLGILKGGYKARKNQELIASIKQLMTKFPHLELIKVQAHCGILENEKADQLATAAAKKAAHQLEEF